MMSPFVAAITGIGIVSAAGIGVEENWKRVTSGESCAQVDPALSGLPTEVSCRVDLSGVDARQVPSFLRRDRYSVFASLAVQEALASAGLEASSWDGTRVAVVIGSGAGGTATLEGQVSTLMSDGPSDVSALTLPMGLLNMAAGQVAIDVGAYGPCFAPCSACASGATAIGIGRDLLRSGAVDIVIAGGAEASITPLYVSAFARMRALSRNQDARSASRPFDSQRDGFVIGEGAGIFILESEAHARARNAGVVAKVVGYGASADAFHVTSPHPSGTGARLAIRSALRDAGLSSTDVSYVNAHGTSTRQNDTAEARVILEEIGGDTPVSSTKGVTGHALGAGASIEAAFTALAISRSSLPPTANLTQPDADMQIDLIMGQPRDGASAIGLTNSFGFGGQNAVLVIAK